MTVLRKRLRRTLALSACTFAVGLATTGACLHAWPRLPTLQTGPYFLVSVDGVGIPATFTSADGTQQRILADTLEFNTSKSTYTERGSTAAIFLDGTVGPPHRVVVPQTTYVRQPDILGLNLPMTITGHATVHLYMDSEIRVTAPDSVIWTYLRR